MANALAKYEEKLKLAKDRFAKYRQKESKTTRVLIDKVVSGVAAYGVGYLETVSPEKMVVGAKKAADGTTTGGWHLSLILGSLASAAEVFDWAGSESDLVGSLGTGLLDAFAFEKGVAKGIEHNNAAAQNA